METILYIIIAVLVITILWMFAYIKELKDDYKSADETRYKGWDRVHEFRELLSKEGFVIEDVPEEPKIRLIKIKK